MIRRNRNILFALAFALVVLATVSSYWLSERGRGDVDWEGRERRVRAAEDRAKTRAERQDEIDTIRKESFAQTLDHSADIEENFVYIAGSGGGSPYSPTLQHSVERTSVSRRFAKLVEEMRDSGADDEHVAFLLARLKADVDQLDRLASGSGLD